MVSPHLRSRYLILPVWRKTTINSKFRTPPVADLRRARTAHGRDEILMERGQRVSEILARRPDLQVRWLTALDEINKRHLLAAAE
jgi:hypothetical protein